MNFELDSDNVRLERDEKGNVQLLDHFQQPFVATSPADSALTEDAAGDAPFSSANSAQGLAEQYLREVAPVYGIGENMLPGSAGGENFDSLTESDTGESSETGNKLELAEEREIMGTKTVSYQQTYNNLPVWEAGVSVTIQPQPMRVTASQSSVHQDITLPPEQNLVDSPYSPERITQTILKQLLGISNDDRTITINEKSRLIYLYEPDKRIDPAALLEEEEALQAAPPTLPLPPVPDSITPEQHYQVTEVLFTLPVEGFGQVNWRVFIEENTGTVLYLRAFTVHAAGLIFRTDPVTAGAGNNVTPLAADALLNPFRQNTTLDGLTNGNPQSLSGQFVKLIENDAPAIPAPAQPNPPASFAYNAKTREFAAVNAYHHCDWLFRLMQGMGFNISSYFDGTSFPVPVDANAFGDILNARAPGNTTGRGSDGFQFGLAGTPFPACSIAADVRVVLHEFGHTLLWDSVHSPNFGFAHSAGDSLAAILMDPESALRNDPARRFETFPWVIPNRNHGRGVASGWGWDGARYNPFVFGGTDRAGYVAEQILSTTLFRLYRSIGGDSQNLNQRKLAARLAVYLIFRAIGSLATNPVTNTARPEIFATALMNADIGTANFEGYLGGALHKVIRWSFEKQGLYQPPGAPRPVTTPGAPPNVDVYINDGRNGEYGFLPVYWETADVWNQLSPGAGGVHETPVVGQTNYAFARVRNRGRLHANNVIARGYSANPGIGLSYPDDWTPMDTPQLTVAGGIAPGASVVVGPFRWTPRFVGHETMFMEVSADGDFSNIDSRTFYPCANGSTADWQLIPFDNNLAQRSVAPVAGGSGLRGLLSSFISRRLTVKNPLEKQARFEVKAELPQFLKERGWRAKLDAKNDGTVFNLAAGASKDVLITLLPGEEFAGTDLVQAEQDLAIRIFAHADGILIGGMTYRLNPDLKQASAENKNEQPVTLDHPEIESQILKARLVKEEAGGETPAQNNQDAEQSIKRNFAENSQNKDLAIQLLSQFGIDGETAGKVSRVKLKKITMELEMRDD